MRASLWRASQRRREIAFWKALHQRSSKLVYIYTSIKSGHSTVTLDSLHSPHCSSSLSFSFKETQLHRERERERTSNFVSVCALSRTVGRPYSWFIQLLSFPPQILPCPGHTHTNEALLSLFISLSAATKVTKHKRPQSFSCTNSHLLYTVSITFRLCEHFGHFQVSFLGNPQKYFSQDK